MGIVRQIKNVTGGYTSSQKLVRDATANVQTPPPINLMKEIAHLTWEEREVLLIMDMLDKRLNDKGKYWLHVQKALILLDYLVHVGSDGVLRWCHQNMYIVKTLREFSYRDESGKEVGHLIRERAVRLTSLLTDSARLERERKRFSTNKNRPRRYRQDADEAGAGDEDDDELARALQLSKETAALEEERRRMAGRSEEASTATDDDLRRAMELSQQNQQNVLNGLTYEQQQQLYWQQQQEELALAQAQQEYLQAQQQSQIEAQRLYELQMAQQAAYQQQQLANQQTPVQQETLQPLKTGSNNPFAAFNQQQQVASPPKSPAKSPSSDSPRPSLHRQSTFDREHMDKLDQILNLNAPMDTFGNTGSAIMPAQHTENTGFVNSSGRGLVAMHTAREKTGSGSNNPFASNTQNQHYTGIASTQMQPAHTGYGFGNANQKSSTNLIDF